MEINQDTVLDVILTRRGERWSLVKIKEGLGVKTKTQERQLAEALEQLTECSLVRIRQNKNSSKVYYVNKRFKRSV